MFFLIRNNVSIKCIFIFSIVHCCVSDIDLNFFVFQFVLIWHISSWRFNEKLIFHNKLFFTQNRLIFTKKLYLVWLVKVSLHLFNLYLCKVFWSQPTGIYLFKVINRNTRRIFEICSKLTIKKPERRNGCIMV